LRKLQERIVAGDFEIYKKYGGDGNESVKRCETLHVMDGQTLFELIENWSTKEEESDDSAFRLVRF
jgi:hypothetical protein